MYKHQINETGSPEDVMTLSKAPLKYFPKALKMWKTRAIFNQETALFSLALSTCEISLKHRIHKHLWIRNN